MGGVMPGDGRGREEKGQEVRAGVGEFVEQKVGAGEFGENRQQARAGGGLQHQVGGGDRRRGGGGEAQPDRRRELLQRLALLGAAGMGGKKPGQPVQHWPAGRRAQRPEPAWPDRTGAGTGRWPFRRPRRRISRSKRLRRRSRQMPPPGRPGAGWNRPWRPAGDRGEDGWRRPGWRRRETNGQPAGWPRTGRDRTWKSLGRAGIGEQPGLSLAPPARPVPAALFLA